MPRVTRALAHPDPRRDPRAAGRGEGALPRSSRREARDQGRQRQLPRRRPRRLRRDRSGAGGERGEQLLRLPRRSREDKKELARRHRLDARRRHRGRTQEPDRNCRGPSARLRARRVAVVQHQGVAVGVAEEGHVADAAVDRRRRGTRRPCASSSARAASTSSTWRASGCPLGLNSWPTEAASTTCSVRLPVSTSPPGIFP